MESDGDQVWLCEAAEIEKLYEETHKRGTFLLAYQLSLSSVEPLQEDHVRTALVHLRRKCPNLRVCIGYRDGNTWFRRSISEEIDFQTVTGIEAKAVRELLQSYRYNSETGPLWCVRLLRDSGNDEFNIDKEKFPHSTQLFLGMHHGIADGVTNLKICGCLVSLLNDVIAGNPIDDEIQIGNFVSDLETDKLVSSKMLEIQKNPQLMQELSMNAINKGLGMPILLNSFPPAEAGEDKMQNILHVLDMSTTTKLINKCKDEDVTLHSAFTALTNASILSLVSEKENPKDFYMLCNGHVVNLRRYWPGDTSNILGCHAHAPVNLWIKVPNNVMDNFWNFTRSLHRDIHCHLNEGTVLVREAYMKLKSKKDASFEDIFQSPCTHQLDVSLSNMGDVTGFVTEGGPYVKPYLVMRQASLHYTNIKNFVHLYHTFRGRLTLNLLYNTKYVTKELARSYVDRIFSLMKQVL